MTSLFDNSNIWLHDPRVAFEAFVLSPEFQLLGRRPATNPKSEPSAPMRASSARIYILMFGKFLRWLDDHDISLLDTTNATILQFLEHTSASTDPQTPVKRDLNSSIRIRYLRIFERVFHHLNVYPNPARHAAFEIYKSQDKQLRGKDLDKVAMTDAEHLAFMQALPVASEPVTGGDTTHGWKRRRDRAMQAIMLGAGLKVSEVIGMAIDHIGIPDSTACLPITVSPASTGGTSRWHQTQLRPFAVDEVLKWKAERSRLNIAGPLLFPASLQGGRLDKATVYRQVKATFERAGIDIQRLGGRTLRNSFAVRELNEGASIELVGEFMGHRKRKSTEHYVLDPTMQLREKK